MTRRDWPLLLIAGGLLLGSAAQALTRGGLDVLGGALLGLGSAVVGAWLRGSASDDARSDDDRRQ